MSTAKRISRSRSVPAMHASPCPMPLLSETLSYDPPSIGEVANELAALWFYLRTTADTDGTALYRLFHQGLADHLRTDPRVGAADPDTAADRILDGLLGTVATD